MTHVDKNRLDKAFAVVERAVMAGEASSGVLAVADHRSLLDCRAYSAPGVEKAATEDTVFLIASISKPIVGTMLMQLVDDGAVTLADPISLYVPEFDAPGKPVVNLWSLLTHTSGLQEETWHDVLRRGDLSEVNDAYLRAACDGSLAFAPRSSYLYCTLSFRLLAEVVARVRGRSYQDELRARVLLPTGMVDTAFDPLEVDPRGTRTASVEGVDARFVPFFTALASPGGGLWSTAADLARFGQAFLNDGQAVGGRLLSPATVSLMTREHTDGLFDFGARDAVPPVKAHYGLAWGKQSYNGWQVGSPRAFGHDGVTGTRLWIDPQYDLVYVYLTNHWESASTLKDRALGAVYGALTGDREEK